MKLGFINNRRVNYTAGSVYSPNKLQPKFELKIRDQLYLIVFVLIVAGLIRYPAEAIKGVSSSIANFVGDRTEASAHVDSPVDSFDPQNIYNPVTDLEEDATGVDFRVQRLTDYLNRYDSPLAPHAAYIIEQSDINGVDWTLIAAISRMESNFCKSIPEDSYNCWGIGGSNFMGFNSYEESIKFEAELLNKHYRLVANRGIKEKYCPSSDGCNDKWSNIVTDTSTELLAKETK